MAPHDFEGEIIPQNHLFAYLRRDGELGGSMDLAVDGSTEPAFFEYISPDSRRSIITRVHPLYFCQNPKPDKFAGLGSGPLANGLKVEVVDENGETLKDYLDGESIRRDSDWNLLAGIDQVTDYTGPIQRVAIRWTIEKSGHSLWLRQKCRFRITIQDDLSGMASRGPFRIMIQGSTYLKDD